MAKSARRLGRGLDSLVSDLRAEPEATPTNAQKPATAPSAARQESAPDDGLQVRMVPTNELNPNPFQPRGTISDQQVLSLAKSIGQSGILQPITARSVSGRLEIIAGERRWRAAKSLRMKAVPVLVRETTDEQMLELALIENLQREDLNAIDRAQAYRRFCDRFELSTQEVATRVSEDRSTVANYLRLLDLPDAIRQKVAGGQLGMGHARCLLGVEDEAMQQRLADAIMENDLSVRAVEEIVRRQKRRGSDDGESRQPAKAEGSAHIRNLEQRFESAVKSKVTIHTGQRKGTGRVVLYYYSLDDFDRITSLLGVPEE